MVLWPKGIQYEKVCLVVTDQATYMVKAFGYLKSTFHNLQHITCLAHALNRVCERIRENFIDINNLMSNMKKVLIKSLRRRQIHTQQTKLN